jgi:hypothetical protein
MREYRRVSLKKLYKILFLIWSLIFIFLTQCENLFIQAKHKKKKQEALLMKILWIFVALHKK